MKKKTEAKRQAILEEASQAFRELGYERTSMAEICARVGGSKATLYNYFASKDELFVAVMSEACEAQFQAAHQALQLVCDDIGDALRLFGESFLTFLYSPEIQVSRRLTITESGRTQLGRLVYEREVLRSQKLIGDFLQGAMARGVLRAADPQVATLHLCSLLESEFIDRFLFQLLGEISADEIRAATGRAVTVFLAAYAPQA